MWWYTFISFVIMVLSFRFSGLLEFGKGLMDEHSHVLVLTVACNKILMDVLGQFRPFTSFGNNSGWIHRF